MMASKKTDLKKDVLVIPDGARAIEMELRLETIGDFVNEAANYEK